MKINTAIIVIIVLSSFGISESNSNYNNSSNMIQIADVNNFVFNSISVDIENNGMLVSHRFSGSSGMEWPLGTNKFIDYCSGIWFAGQINGEIRTAVGEYGPEFVPGTYGSDPEDQIHRIYYVSTTDLNNPMISPDIVNWPWTEGAPWIDSVYRQKPLDKCRINIKRDSG